MRGCITSESETCNNWTKVSTIFWHRFSPGRPFENAAHGSADPLVARALLVHALHSLVVSRKADTSLIGYRSTMDAIAGAPHTHVAGQVKQTSKDWIAWLSISLMGSTYSAPNIDEYLR